MSGSRAERRASAVRRVVRERVGNESRKETHNPMRSALPILCLVFVLTIPQLASARDAELFHSARIAAERQLGKERLLDIPFYMKGEEHPGIKKTLGKTTANWVTRGAFRSKEESCEVAFLSAMIELQERAKAQGGNALVDVISITDSVESESATQFRCVAGLVVVKVGLKGTIVEM